MAMCQYGEFFLSAIVTTILKPVSLFEKQIYVPIYGIFVNFSIIGNILEVHANIESCFTIMRAIVDLFTLYHLRAKLCCEKQIFPMEGECMLWKANLCRGR